MSLTLLFPLGLLALAAWALPLLLHLARREQRTLTEFAALRWLSIRQKPRQRLRFDEIPLLAVRLALLAAIALLLARPALTGGGDGRAWEVFHPSVPVPAAGIDDGIERRWLGDGFPPIGAPPPAPMIATASLLRQLDAELPPGASLTVYVPATLDGMDGERPRLSRPVDWRVAAPTASVARPAPGPPAIPVLAVRHDDTHAAEAEWLRAVAIAWRAADSAADGAIVAWFVSGAIPAEVRTRVERGGTLLLPADADWPLPTPGATIDGDEGEPVAEVAALGDGRVVRLRRPLHPAAWPALLEPAFPRQLRDLVAAPAPAPARVEAAAHAPIEGGPGFAPAPREFPAVLAWLVIALFALERWLATGRRPEPGA